MARNPPSGKVRRYEITNGSYEKPGYILHFDRVSGTYFLVKRAFETLQVESIGVDSAQIESYLKDGYGGKIFDRESVCDMDPGTFSLLVKNLSGLDEKIKKLGSGRSRETEFSQERRRLITSLASHLGMY